MIFGVDSAISANARLANGFQTFDWVVRKSRYPTFWGRHLDGKFGITKGEMAFIHEKGCKIILIYTGACEDAASIPPQPHDGAKAIDAAKKMRIPRNRSTAIFVKARADRTLPDNWVFDYANTLSNAGYIPGFITDARYSPAVLSDHYHTFFYQLSEAVDRFGSLVWSTEPYQPEPVSWEPNCPPGLAADAVSLWQTGRFLYSSAVFHENLIKNETILEYGC